MIKSPLLSIVLPNYNHAHFLPCALDSLLAQTFTDFECLIVDDGSTDGSLEILHDYLKQDSRLRLLRHSRNRGVAAACATGLEKTEGTYLQLLSASDALAQSYFQEALSLLLKYPHIGLCCTDVGLFEKTPSEHITYRLLETPHPLLFLPDTIAPIFKYARFNIPGLSTIVKKSSYLKYGGYHPQLHFMCDWFLNHQIALFEGALYIPQTLAFFREPGYSKASSQNPHTRNEAINTLINLLLHPANAPLFKKMKQAALLGILAKERPHLLKNRAWGLDLYLPLIQRYVYTKFRKWFKRPQISQSKLKRYLFF